MNFFKKTPISLLSCVILFAILVTPMTASAAVPLIPLIPVAVPVATAGVAAVGAIAGGIGSWLFEKAVSVAAYITIFLTIVEVLSQIFSWLLWATGVMFDFVVNNLVLGMGIYVLNSSGVYVAWSIVRDLANIGIIGGLVAAAFGTILQLSNVNASKLLAKIIIAALLVNFSYFFAAAIIDVSNFTAGIIYKSMVATPTCPNCNISDTFVRLTNFHAFKDAQTIQGRPTPPPAGSTFGNILDTINNTLGAPFGIPSAASVRASMGTINPFDHLMLDIVFIILEAITIYIFLSAIALLIGRFVSLVLILVASPIGIAALAIPGIQSWGKRWWQALFSQALFAPLYFLFVAISLGILKQLVPIIYDTRSNILAITTILGFIIAAAFMIISLRLAKQMSEQAGELSSVYKGAQKMAGWMPAAYTGGLQFGGGWAYRNTAGYGFERAKILWDNKISPRLTSIPVLGKILVDSGLEKSIAHGLHMGVKSKILKQKSYEETKAEQQARNAERTATEQKVEKMHEMLKGEKLAKDLDAKERELQKRRSEQKVAQKTGEATADYQKRINETKDDFKKRMEGELGLVHLREEVGLLHRMDDLQNILGEMEAEKIKPLIDAEKELEKRLKAKTLQNSGETADDFKKRMEVDLDLPRLRMDGLQKNRDAVRDANGRVRRVKVDENKVVSKFQVDANGKLVLDTDGKAIKDVVHGQYVDDANGELGWLESTYQMRERLKKETGFGEVRDDLSGMLSDLDPRILKELYDEDYGKETKDQTLVKLARVWTDDQAKMIFDNKDFSKGIRDAVKDKRYKSLYDMAETFKKRLRIDENKNDDGTYKEGADIEMYSPEYHDLKENIYFVTRNEIKGDDLLEALSHNKKLLTNPIYAQGILSSEYDKMQKSTKFTVQEKRILRRLKRNLYNDANQLWNEGILGLEDEESKAYQALMTDDQKVAALKRAEKKFLDKEASVEEKLAARLIIGEHAKFIQDKINSGELATLTQDQINKGKTQLELMVKTADTSMANWIKGKSAEEVNREVKQEHMDEVLFAKHLNQDQRAAVAGKDNTWKQKLDYNLFRVGKSRFLQYAINSDPGREEVGGMPSEAEIEKIDAIRTKVGNKTTLEEALAGQSAPTPPAPPPPPPDEGTPTGDIRAIITGLSTPGSGVTTQNLVDYIHRLPPNQVTGLQSDVLESPIPAAAFDARQLRQLLESSAVSPYTRGILIKNVLAHNLRPEIQAAFTPTGTIDVSKL